MSFRALRSVSSLVYRAATPRAGPKSLSGLHYRTALSPRIVAPATRTFSVSTRRLGQGESDLSLSQKLHEEIKFELEAAKANAGVPDFLRDFQSTGIWNIEDVEGQDEVALVRTIRILFSIADIDAPQDPAFDDIEGAEGEDVPVPVAPIRCSIVISKASTPATHASTLRRPNVMAQNGLLECALLSRGSDQGALSIDALAQDGAMVVDNISFYKEAKLATDLSADADWKRRGLYIGPQFDHLDTNVQEEFERFLEERGIGGDLALFVPEYAEYKEQKEYVKWLQNVKSFVDV